MAKKKTKGQITSTQGAMFGLMLLGGVGLMTLNLYYPDAFSNYYLASGAGLFVLALLYFYMIRKK